MSTKRPTLVLRGIDPNGCQATVSLYGSQEQVELAVAAFRADGWTIMREPATVVLRISATIENEYANRQPDFLPLDKLHEGRCTLTLEEARAVAEDAAYNSDLRAFSVGMDDMPLGTFNAYRALAKQARAAIAKAEGGAQ